MFRFANGDIVKKERRTEITLKTERSISVKSSRALTALCEPCGRQVQMFTPGQAALISGLSSREVYHRVEMGEVHFMETVEGLLLVCLDSLLSHHATALESEAESEADSEPVPQLQDGCSATEDDNE
jgi:hypothetical protein